MNYINKWYFSKIYLVIPNKAINVSDPLTTKS